MNARDYGRAWAVWGALLVCCIAVWACILASGCAAAKEVAAEGTYTGQQLECVDRNETRAAIDSCRAAVRLKWGRLPDGGAAEGGAP